MLTITTESKFGNSSEQVQLNSVEEYNKLKVRLRRLHANDGATVYATGQDFFEQIR